VGMTPPRSLNEVIRDSLPGTTRKHKRIVLLYS
jgi:hypothetical protein